MGPGATAGALQKLRVYVEGLWGSQGRPSRARFRGHTPVHSHRKGGGFWVLNIGSAEVEGRGNMGSRQQLPWVGLGYSLV